MLYTVELHLGADSLVARMGKMREWLDNHRCEPALFQHRGRVLRVDFKVEKEAMAFAEAFGGSILIR